LLRLNPGEIHDRQRADLMTTAPKRLGGGITGAEALRRNRKMTSTTTHDGDRQLDSTSATEGADRWVRR